MYCPHCDSLLKCEGTSKVTGARRYYCHGCGQHFIKDKGTKGLRKGQF